MKNGPRGPVFLGVLAETVPFEPHQKPAQCGLFSWPYSFQAAVPWLGDAIDRTLDAGGMDAEMVSK